MRDLFKKYPRTAFTTFGATFGLIFGLLVIGNLPVGKNGGVFEGVGWLFGLLVGSTVGFRLGGRKGPQ